MIGVLMDRKQANLALTAFQHKILEYEQISALEIQVKMIDGTRKHRLWMTDGIKG